MVTAQCTGYVLYIEEMEEYTYFVPHLSAVVVDIDAEPCTERIVLDDVGDIYTNVYVRLRGVMKQFPQVKRLELSCRTKAVEISNFMFPYTEYVVYHGAREDKKTECLEIDGTLYNSFCKSKNQVIDMQNVKSLAPHSMEGCSAGLANMRYFHISNEELVESGYMGTASPGDMDAFVGSGYKAVCYPEVGETAKMYIKVCKPVIYAKIDLKACVDCLTEIEDISMSENQAFTVKDNMIFSKDGKELIKCPKSRAGRVEIPEGVEVLEINSLRGTEITEIVTPSTLRRIEGFAFSSGYRLEKVILNEGLREIEEYAFEDSIKVKSITLPASLEVIKENAFPVLDTVYIKGDRVPTGIVEGVTIGHESYRFTEAELIQAVECRTESGLVFMVPRNMAENFDYDSLNDSLYRGNYEILKTLYRQARTKEGRQVCALRMYLATGDEEAKKYLKRVSKALIATLIKNSLENDLISYVKTGLVSRANLKYALEEARKKGMSNAEACIMAQADGRKDTGGFSL